MLTCYSDFAQGEFMCPINKSRPLMLDSRLGGYAALAGATLAAPVVSQAAIVYSGPVSITIPTTTAGIYLNVVNGVFATSPGGSPGWDLNPWGTGSLFIYGNNSASPNDGVLSNFVGGSSATLVDNIPVGTLIDSTWTYGRTNATETSGLTAFVVNSSNNLIGFRFLNESTGQVDFGWMRFSLSTSPTAQPRLIVEYAYENTGTAILAGQTVGVPEPSTMALFG